MKKFNKVKFRHHIPLYLMMLPGLIYFLVYKYLPMYGVVMAFQEFRLAKGFFRSEWIGWKNFSDFFTSAFFPIVMENTLIISFSKLLLGFPAPIILALMLDAVRCRWYKRTVQTIVYLPHFISWVIMGNIISIFFSGGSGVIPQLLKEWFGIQVNWLGEDTPFRILLVLSDIWKEVARAFTFDDPDGNGKDDTVGLAGVTATGLIDQCTFGLAVGAYGETFGWEKTESGDWEPIAGGLLLWLLCRRQTVLFCLPSHRRDMNLQFRLSIT